MSSILLTQNTTPIFGQICLVLGWLMEGIFYVLKQIGIPNIGLAIIIFTIIMYIFMLPITYKTQKFSKLSAKMQPELNAVREKYKGRKDNASMMAMQEEQNAVFEKYGVSPTGSCGYMAIQMPILFALYQVINKIPAYVGTVKESFVPLVDKMVEIQGSADFIQTFTNARMFANQFKNDLFINNSTEYVKNTFIDVLNKASSAEYLSIADKYPELKELVMNSYEQITNYNSFLGGINISNSPSFIVTEAFKSGAYLTIVIALMYPVLSAVTQFINVKLMPQPSNSDNGQDTMSQSLKTMNMTMPIMSAFFCYTLPVGLGIYWIAGAVVRTVQQIMINKSIDKIDWDAEIEKNRANAAKKNKKKVNSSKLAEYAGMSTKSTYADKASSGSGLSETERQKLLEEKKALYDAAPAGSITAKANLVKKFNEGGDK